jgi:hypothetical protein
MRVVKMHCSNQRKVKLIDRKTLIEAIILESYRFSREEYRGNPCVPIKPIKRKLMKTLRLNRTKFDELLLSEGCPSYHTDGLYLARCGLRQTSKLNYVTTNTEHPTFQNSFCFFQINVEIARTLVARQEAKPNTDTTAS